MRSGEFDNAAALTAYLYSDASGSLLVVGALIKPPRKLLRIHRINKGILVDFLCLFND